MLILRTNTLNIFDIMDNNTLLELLPTFTIENWETIDTFRSPTISVSNKDKAIEKLANLWIEYPETLTKEFVIWLLTQLDTKEFIGDNYDKWVDDQIILFGSLEEAFNDLVVRFL